MQVNIDRNVFYYIMIEQGMEDIDMFAPATMPPADAEIDMGMLVDPEQDDDLFDNQVPEQVQPAEAPSSKLLEWEAEKNQELTQNDSANQEKDNQIRTEASEKLQAFFETLSEAQKNRAKHNLEVDQEFIADLESESAQKWEKVVKYIDFNRTDLHERDNTKMKSLLLQLKH